MWLYTFLGEGHGTPLQSSCRENPMDGGAWWAAVHGVTRSQTCLSDFTFTFHFRALEKEMATHCSVLAWRLPGTGEPRGLPSMGSHIVGHDWSGLAAAAAVHTPIYTFSWKCSTDPHKFDPIYSLHFLLTFPLVLAFLVAQMVKCLSATWETQVQSLGREDPLEKEMATHSSTLGKSHEQRSLVGYGPWGRKESDTTEWLHFPFLSP